ncbi:MAG: hypothetical protein WCL08_04000 [Verrucomicrobiota bacterium]
MDAKRIEELSDTTGEEIKILPGYNHAMLGIAWVGGEAISVYDEDLVIEHLMEKNGWTRAEALDYHGYNMDNGEVLYLTK